MGIFDDLSHALVPHRQSMEHEIGSRLDRIIAELCQLNAHGEVGKPSMYDKWSTRPFAGKGVGSIEIARSPLREAYILQAIWVKAVNAAAAPNPSFLLLINGLPVWALEFGRKLAEKEAGFLSEKLSGDILVPRGSVLEIQPALGTETEVTFEGAVTFRRELLIAPAPNAGAGVSNERFDRPSATLGQYEPDRGIPELEGSRWHSQSLEDEQHSMGVGGDIAPDPVIAGEPDDTYPET
jgi:hypothetical protein